MQVKLSKEDDLIFSKYNTCNPESTESIIQLLIFGQSTFLVKRVKKFKSLFTLKVLCPMIKGCILDSADSGLHKKYLATMKSTSLLHGF